MVNSRQELVMEIVDIKKEACFVGQYIELRNSYTELLLTHPVDMSGTIEWLKRGDIEIKGVVEGGLLLGAVILYLDRDNEVAFFARERNKGIGSKLLGIVELVAFSRGLESLRAWVLERNVAARQTFEKNGFIEVGISGREYQGSVQQGIDYKKNLKGNHENAG